MRGTKLGDQILNINLETMVEIYSDNSKIRYGIQTAKGIEHIVFPYDKQESCDAIYKELMQLLVEKKEF